LRGNNEQKEKVVIEGNSNENENFGGGNHDGDSRDRSNKFFLVGKMVNLVIKNQKVY
jgi:hypothetical protein